MRHACSICLRQIEGITECECLCRGRTNDKRPQACVACGLLVGGPVDGLVAAAGANRSGRRSQKESVTLECKPDPRVGFDRLLCRCVPYSENPQMLRSAVHPRLSFTRSRFEALRPPMALNLVPVRDLPGPVQQIPICSKKFSPPGLCRFLPDEPAPQCERPASCQGAAGRSHLFRMERMQMPLHPGRICNRAPCLRLRKRAPRIQSSTSTHVQRCRPTSAGRGSPVRSIPLLLPARTRPRTPPLLPGPRPARERRRRERSR
jgi:hypothetical protein